MEHSGKTPEGPAAIKSAQRVLEILELFSEKQRPVTVTEVCEILGYPQSSTSGLLSSLVTLGYLTRDQSSGRYSPTLRVMLLGTWMQDRIFADGSLLARMEALQNRTGAAVLVGLRQGIHVRFILSLHSKKINAPHYPVGVIRPVCRSAAGKALLATLDDAEITRIARNANARASEPLEVVDVQKLLVEIRTVRKRGWAESIDYPLPGRVTLGMLVPPIPGQPALAAALGFRTESLESNREAMLNALRVALQKNPSH